MTILIYMVSLSMLNKTEAYFSIVSFEIYKKLFSVSSRSTHGQGVKFWLDAFFIRKSFFLVLFFWLFCVVLVWCFTQRAEQSNLKMGRENEKLNRQTRIDNVKKMGGGNESKHEREAIRSLPLNIMIWTQRVGRDRQQKKIWIWNDKTKYIW